MTKAERNDNVSTDNDRRGRDCWQHFVSLASGQFKMLSSTVIYQLNAFVFRCEAFRPLSRWPIIDSGDRVSELERSWKGQWSVAGVKRRGVAAWWAWPSDRSSFHSLLATLGKHNECYRTDHLDSSCQCGYVRLNEKRY